MRLLTYFCLLLLVLPALAYRVTDITVVPGTSMTQISIIADGPVTYEKFLLTDPMRIVLDIEGAVHSLPSTDFSIYRGGIASIRTSQYKAPPDGIVRIIIDIDGELMNYDVNLDVDKLNIVLQIDPSGLPFTAWSASSQFVEPTLTHGSVAPLSTAASVSVVTDPQSTGTYNSSRGIQISVPLEEIDDGLPAIWEGTGGRKITIDVVDADLRTILRAMSDISGYNIMLPQGFNTSVTARLQDVGWRDGLTAILNSLGLVATLQENTGVLRVMSRSNFYSEINTIASSQLDRESFQETQTQVFVIRYATAASISGALSSAMSSRGYISVDTRTNSLIITDIPRKLEEVSRLLPILDSPTAQVMIEAKLVEIDANYAQELGIDWSMGNLGRSNELYQYGVNTSGLLAGGETFKLEFGTITDFLDINTTITMLEQENHATILSEPRIAIIDNMTGSVVSGKQIPLTLLDPSGNSYVSMHQIGVSLSVTPHINADNNVTLTLRPDVSELSGEASASGQPIILTQNASTTLMINDGDTAVIGGIMRSRHTTVRKQIPILGHIPFIGDLLFSYNSDRLDRTELVIFVTPHIIRPY